MQTKHLSLISATFHIPQSQKFLVNPTKTPCCPLSHDFALKSELLSIYSKENE